MYFFYLGGHLAARNIFRGERYKWNARFTVVNLSNKIALYNFLSTFCGTQYVTQHSETSELGFHF